ncbi:MAG TPA: protein kinase, partial [Vicinamibacterales bacterium]|nr:protein kinase [Vicinamibacterales bacterium]
MEQVPAGARCPTCGAVRPPDAPGGLCPACLLGVAAEPDGASSGGDATRLTTNQPVRLERATGAEGSDDLTRISQDRPSPPDAASARVVPVPGQPFGPYLVTRLLGRGGMGEVYEVEQRDTGRRLALKVLRGRIGGAENRARFLREGQLAASVSHPHTVYIYGSEEIAGAPVIAMELLSGGTLQDRVTEGGPMPVADAVRAVLEIIGGLDAAQAAGILHRDIKPSNCFTDADGGVKVGDFGLSISTLASDVGAGVTTQGFEGTPQFAAPEQLRGEPLDVRADIYAVGATLYYLLTGQPPFQAHDLRELVALVTTAPPPSPRVKAPQVPAPLAQVVMRCLAKDPADRPSSYAALAEQLRPFATTPAVPAGLGSRLLAGVIDAVIIGAPINMITSSQTRAMPSGFQASIDTAAIWSLIAGALYFLILEGRWAASLGKRLLGLRVISARGSLTWKQVAIRTVLYYSPSSPTLLATLLVGAPALTVWLNAHPLWAVLFAISNFILLGCLFLTARARNGRAAIHDLASGTRVVVSAAATRLTGRGTVGPTPDAAASRAKIRIGPFEADATVPAADGTMLAEGFDPVLRRRVWIHVVRPGTPPLDPVRRDTGRPGRLRWLTGRRDEGGQWDAFEAPDGMPLDAIARASATWAVAKRWLVDLAAELQESAAEGSMPVLALDRVWIRADDRAVLLDFPVPTTMLGPAPAPAASARPLTDPMAFLA